MTSGGITTITGIGIGMLLSPFPFSSPDYTALRIRHNTLAFSDVFLGHALLDKRRKFSGSHQSKKRQMFRRCHKGFGSTAAVKKKQWIFIFFLSRSQFRKIQSRSEKEREKEVYNGAATAIRMNGHGSLSIPKRPVVNRDRK